MSSATTLHVVGDVLPEDRPAVGTPDPVLEDGKPRVDWLAATLDGPLFTESGPVIAHATCDYKQPLTYPATLTIDVYATPPGNSSLKNVYDASLKQSDERVATGTAVLVWVSVDTGETVPVPDLGLR